MGIVRCPEDGTEIDVDRLFAVSTTMENAATEVTARGAVPHAPESDPLLGTRVDKYDIEEVIGRGGMGTVYRARHADLGHELALKVLDSRLWGSSDVTARFFQEAKAAARIGHPNIVQIFDFARSPAAGSYIVMELLRGEPLDVVIKRDAPFSESRAIGLALQICEALGSAHKQGVVHRDLKPANVFLVATSTVQTPHGSTAGETIKVMDFGVAKLSQSASAVATRPGTLVGTPLYMSPEQWESGPTDARSDIYSLGLVLYEMLTGRLPYAGTLTQVIKSLTLEEPRPPRAFRKDLTPELDALVLRCIRKDPDARYASMDDVARDLRALAGARSSVTVMPPGPVRPARVWGIVLGIGLVAAAAVLFLKLRGSSDARPVSPPPEAVSLAAPPPPVLPSASAAASAASPPAVSASGSATAPPPTASASPPSTPRPRASARASATPPASASAAPSASAKSLLYSE